MRQVSAAIEIGTSKVVCTIAEKGVYEGFNLLGAGAIEYSGYSQNGWNDPAEVKYAISSALHQAEKQAGYRAHYINVGIPADFTQVVCRKVGLNFGKSRRITQDDINLLFKRGETFTAFKNYGVVHRCPIFFNINNERRTMDPVNLMAERITSYVSYILAERGFVDSITRYLKAGGYDVDTIVSSVFAQGMAYIPPENRDKTAIFIDIGHRMTSVSVFKGDGILYHNTIPVGGLQITKDLAITMRISDDVAEQLKKRAVYGLTTNRDDRYELLSEEAYRLMRFPAGQVQEIINARLVEICDMLKQELTASMCILPEYVGIYLTGGTSEMRGIRELVQKSMARNVTLIQPKSTKLNRACFSAALGVTDLVMDKYQVEEKSIFDQFKQIFKRK